MPTVKRTGLIRVEVLLETPCTYGELLSAIDLIRNEAVDDSIAPNDNAIQVTIELGRVIVLSYHRPYRPSDAVSPIVNV